MVCESGYITFRNYTTFRCNTFNNKIRAYMGLFHLFSHRSIGRHRFFHEPRRRTSYRFKDPDRMGRDGFSNRLRIDVGVIYKQNDEASQRALLYWLSATTASILSTTVDALPRSSSACFFSFSSADATTAATGISDSTSTATWAL